MHLNPYRIRCLTLASLIAIAVPLAAEAGDGRIPINQSKALAGGVTPGDTAGLPVSITQSGSFFLAGDLSIDENTTAILVTANDVTIDLNGFAIRGPTVCTTSCTPIGTGRGIDADGQEGLVVFGGTIAGTGSDGIRAGTATRIEDISFLDIGDSSVSAFVDSIIHNTRTERVRTGAIAVNSQCHAVNNSVQDAGGDGISCGNANIMRNNTIFDVVTGLDFSGGLGGVVEGNSITQASSLGVNANGVVLVDNSINLTTLSAVGSTAALGIGNALTQSSSRGFQGSGLFLDNTIQNNTSYALELFGGAYGHNVMNDNNGGAGIQVGGGAASNQVAGNMCHKDLTCP